ncbi:MAG: DUF2085 domain-containing protein [Planctomycetota bacterium]|nr:DUF2085 domain-containing protein [Planctomycetota bacterium]
MTDARAIFAAAFSHVCGQGRCFVVEGLPLPLCQRCLGLYLAAGLTLLWLLATRRWRRGLPALPVLALHTMALLIALAGGLHWLDLGPRWRFLCGLLTGHVLATWLILGALALRRPKTGKPTIFRDLLPLAILIALALGPWPDLPGAWWGLSVAAALSAAGVFLAAALALGAWAVRLLARPG